VLERKKKKLEADQKMGDLFRKFGSCCKRKSSTSASLKDGGVPKGKNCGGRELSSGNEGNRRKVKIRHIDQLGKETSNRRASIME